MVILQTGSVTCAIHSSWAKSITHSLQGRARTLPSASLHSRARCAVKHLTGTELHGAAIAISAAEFIPHIRGGDRSVRCGCGCRHGARRGEVHTAHAMRFPPAAGPVGARPRVFLA